MNFKNRLSKIVVVLFMVFICNMLPAQPPPPSNHGSTGNETPDNGGSAPIGGGLFILMALGAAYGSKKVYNFQKSKLAE